MSDGWFSNKLAPGGDAEDGCHPDEAEALKKYLRQEIVAEEAARAMSQPILNASNPGEDLPRLWGLLIDALVELPSDKIESLITLVEAIENLPEPGYGGRRREQAAGSWQALAWAAGVWPSLRRHPSINRLAVAGLAGIPINWGCESVADALERSDALLDFQIPVAAEWLEIAGARFMEGAIKGEESWALDRQRGLWEGKMAMSVQRYSYSQPPQP